MLKVGLTGGIGCGKTNVARELQELGCHVYDADQIARDVVRPGTKGLRALVAEFGPEILSPQGELDRARLGQIIFSDVTKRNRLNEILHPIIIAEQNRLIHEADLQDPEGIVIIDAALMIETGSHKRFDKLIVVYCDRETQITRVMNRNKLTRAEAEARVNAQMPTEEKLKFADFTIDTSGSMAETYTKIIELFQKLYLLTKDNNPDYQF